MSADYDFDMESPPRHNDIKRHPLAVRKVTLMIIHAVDMK